MKVRAKAAGAERGGARRRLSRAAARVLADESDTHGTQHLAPPPRAHPRTPAESMERLFRSAPEGPVRGPPFFFFSGRCRVCGAART